MNVGPCWLRLTMTLGLIMGFHQEGIQELEPSWALQIIGSRVKGNDDQFIMNILSLSLVTDLRGDWQG